MHDITTKTFNTDLIDPQAQNITLFLQSFGLPHEGIIADQNERNVIGNALPNILGQLMPDDKANAYYLSKFVVGAGFGLFDYALNAIWNEVILNLRSKAIIYGLDIFYDEAVGGSRREHFKDEKNLAELKDNVLLDTCKKLELISDITHKKISHILDMRNNVGISHPNNSSINAYELLGWLQNCIKDVLQDKPTDAAIQIQVFIKNLTQEEEIISPDKLRLIEQKLGELSSHQASKILQSIFNTFTKVNTSPNIDKNISMLAPILWNLSNDEVKYKLGIRLEGLKNNLHHNSSDKGNNFFNIVQGNNYKTNNDKAMTIDSILDNLHSVHHSYNNYSQEAPIAAELSGYIQKHTDILEHNVRKLVDVVLICRLGNGYDYCDGVSPNGKKYYDHILSLLGNKYAINIILSLINNHTLNNRIHNKIVIKQINEVIENIKFSITDERLIECFNEIQKHLKNGTKFYLDTTFKQLSAPLIKW
ncbi:hypothetical protein J7624_00090 [Wohlfahrtiimonas chitiniclastica]|uniref:hypothetical protein n=1 Tax=Wohlfahrtiimonas chitiniclastica TaxID=400946 RepID=UPI001BCCA830|nr:hypothetical protein [Wohlfahrtiimonas chitiniclastica]MBS7825549.1 hypothetical protein [Wohlfahrtiimonas chitiniclastica]